MNERNESPIFELKRQFFDIETEAFGTAKIFERKKNVLNLPRMLLTFLGIAVPLIVGSVALSFGLDSKIFPILLSILGGVSVLQITTALWSLVSKWDDKYIYYNESQKENTAIYNEAKKAKEDVNADNIEKFKLILRDIKNKAENRERLDLDHNISEEEKRYATRARNLYYRSKCHICEEVPQNMIPGKCDGCGNYRLFKSN